MAWFISYNDLIHAHFKLKQGFIFKSQTIFSNERDGGEPELDIF